MDMGFKKWLYEVFSCTNSPSDCISKIKESAWEGMSQLIQQNFYLLSVWMKSAESFSINLWVNGWSQNDILWKRLLRLDVVFVSAKDKCLHIWFQPVWSIHFPPYFSFWCLDNILQLGWRKLPHLQGKPPRRVFGVTLFQMFLIEVSRFTQI